MSPLDISASLAASTASTFSATPTINFGGKVYNFGTGQSVDQATSQTPTSSTNQDARATAATAKEGGQATASMTPEPTFGTTPFFGSNNTPIIIAAAIVAASAIFGFLRKG